MWVIWGLFNACLVNVFEQMFVNHCSSAHQVKAIENKIYNQRIGSAALKRLGFLFYGALILPFGAHWKFPVNKTDWRWAMCFPFFSSPYNSLLMSHITIALAWLSFNLCAQWLHQRAILQFSPGINHAWKHLVMNLDCLEFSTFHDQTSQLAVWFIPECHISGGKERSSSCP